MVETKVKSKKSILSLIFIAVLFFMSLIGLSACKVFDDDNSGLTANVDADGLLRVPAPIVTFNAYSKSGDQQLVDENSGSFTWPLQYYYKTGREANRDQNYYMANFFEDEKFEKAFDYRKFNRNKRPIYSSSKYEILSYYFSDMGATVSADGSKITNNATGQETVFTYIGFDSSAAHFYAIDNTDGANIIRRVYTGADELLAHPLYRLPRL